MSNALGNVYNNGHPKPSVLHISPQKIVGQVCGILASAWLRVPGREGLQRDCGLWEPDSWTRPEHVDPEDFKEYSTEMGTELAPLSFLVTEALGNLREAVHGLDYLEKEENRGKNKKIMKKIKVSKHKSIRTKISKEK
ncbi:hypothetical protein E2C01_101972 [Portunus trituberculatus]|uniref:Uncharacterized protein n=1 Tax=Portunus trituberculatus TaxID=210409 RepID=A0A5B7KLN1_PORTR|nr:hypothetical protein [Portunus trituberculatus]